MMLAPSTTAIATQTGQKIERVKMPSFNYTYTALFDEAKSSKPGANVTGSARGVRLRGGYYFGPSRRRR